MPALPSISLNKYCYNGMFSNCQQLKNVSILPATSLSESCYEGMFYGCTQLVNPPKMSAYYLANNCCFQMFYGCTSLTCSPELHAPKIMPMCYYAMFHGCSSLSKITMLATDFTNQSASFTYWVSGVASSGTFIMKSGASLGSGYSGIPSGWTVIYT